jgi:hypothetical protein
MQRLNGTSYEFSNGKLTAYGGNGYGSFSRNEFTRVNDTVSIIATYCVGHCGSQPVDYSKQVFNQSGQLVYRIDYPSMAADDESEEKEEPEGEEVMEEDAPAMDYIEEGEVMTLEEYDHFLMRYVTDDQLPDTAFYAYDNKGLLLQMDESSGANAADTRSKLFESGEDVSQYKFHQCYIGRMRMERFILKKLGYTPELLLLEIHRHGVFSFRLDPKSQKYYEANTLMLD